MFVRSRLQCHRLQLSIVDTNRVDGRVRSTHIAALGSVPSDMSVPGRAAFWGQAERRVDKLGNQLDKATREKLLGELRTKIPVPTKAEQQEAKREAAKARAEFENAIAIVKKAGWSDADVVLAIRMTELDENEMRELTDETARGFERVQRAAFNKIRRRSRAAP
jgi:hypothetical protein